MNEDKLIKLILTLAVLGGFALIVLVYMFVDMSDKNAEVVKTIITGSGTACLLVLGFWFAPSSKA